MVSLEKSSRLGNNTAIFHQKFTTKSLLLSTVFFFVLCVAISSFFVSYKLLCFWLLFFFLGKKIKEKLALEQFIFSGLFSRSKYKIISDEIDLLDCTMQ